MLGQRLKLEPQNRQHPDAAAFRGLMPMGWVERWCAELLLSSASSGAAFPLTEWFCSPPSSPGPLPVLNPEEKKKHLPPLNELGTNRLCQILVLTS